MAARPARRAAARGSRVRLVKGAYWDAEVKRAQELGLERYPVFTARRATDLAYLACAQRLLDASELLHPQFATHNPITVACVLGDGAAGGATSSSSACTAWARRSYAALRRELPALPVRVYAPVGSHERPARLPGAPPARERRQHARSCTRPPTSGSRSSAARPIRSPFRRRAAPAGAESRGSHCRPPACAERMTSPRSDLQRSAQAVARRRGPRRARSDRRRDVRGSSEDGGSAGASPMQRSREAVRAAPMRRAAIASAQLRHAGRDRRRSARAAILERVADAAREPTREELVALCVARSRQDARRRAWPTCARRWISAATTRPQARRLFAPARAAQAGRRAQRALAARPRRLRLHQPVEFPAGDLHRAGRAPRSSPATRSSPSPPSRRRCIARAASRS